MGRSVAWWRRSWAILFGSDETLFTPTLTVKHASGDQSTFCWSPLAQTPYLSWAQLNRHFAYAWHATQNKTFEATSRTRKMCQYHNPWDTKQVRGMLKAKFRKWLFRFSTMKLSFQLRSVRYYRMNNNSKRDKIFIYADAWHATQNRTFRSGFWTSRSLKICQYHNPWVTKPVLCPFLNHWIYFWIVVRVFRAQLGLICVWQI